MTPIEMKNPFLIAPSILAGDLSRLGEELKAMEQAGVDVIHLDVMDGHFVPNLTFGFPVIRKLRELTTLPFDAHLMIDNADKYLNDFKHAGADWISVHVEACPDILKTVKDIRRLGIRAGVAINPETPLERLAPALDEVDYVLVMSVHPGFEGQSFIENSFERVRQVKKMLGKRKVRIEIDGGIKAHNLEQALAAGAEIVVMGTGLFKSADYKATVFSLRILGSKRSR